MDQVREAMSAVMVEILVQKSVWTSLVSDVGFASKLQFRSSLFVFEMNQNCSFVQFVSGPKMHRIRRWSLKLMIMDQIICIFGPF